MRRTTMTTVAPAGRQTAAFRLDHAASGSSRSPCVFAAIVWLKPPLVITPMMPTLTPAASTRIDGRTFGQATGRPVPASIRLAARNGKDASAARALSAPRGSRADRAGRRRRSGWSEVELVIAHCGGGVAERVVGRDNWRAFPQVRLERPLPHVAGVDQQHGAAIARAGRAEVLHVAREQGEAAVTILGKDAAVEIVGADDRERDGRRLGVGRDLNRAKGDNDKQSTRGLRHADILRRP